MEEWICPGCGKEIIKGEEFVRVEGKPWHIGCRQKYLAEKTLYALRVISVLEEEYARRMEDPTYVLPIPSVEKKVKGVLDEIAKYSKEFSSIVYGR